MITILTPTYNRANTLPALYRSLKNQSSMNFQWLVIDDGSNDETEQLIKGYVSENIINLEYHKKENGGKHTALNFSHPFIKGELLWIVDSDDTIVSDAVSIVESDWNKYHEDKTIAGITYLKGSDMYHPLHGFRHKSDEFISDSIKAHVNMKHVPDACEILRTDIFNSILFPEHKGEKFLGESYLWNTIGFNYRTVYINKVLYICTYLEGGLTRSGRALRIHSPLGGMDNSKTYFNKKVVLRQRIKNALLYGCYGFFANYNLSQIIKSSKSILVAVLLPLEYCLYIYWKKKYD